MAYCTYDDLKKILPEIQLIRLTDDENYGDANQERISESIDTSSEEIDAYIGGRVGLPIDAGDIPPILKKFCGDITIYNLYARVREDIPEIRNSRYKNVIKSLEKFAEGRLTLGLQPAPDPPGEGEYSGGSLVNARTKDFDTTAMDKY